MPQRGRWNRKALTIFGVLSLIFAMTESSYPIDFASIPTGIWVKDDRISTLQPTDESGWTSFECQPNGDICFTFGLNSDGKGGIPNNQVQYANDSWEFNLATGQWMLTHPTDPYPGGPSSGYPNQRHPYHSIVYDPNKSRFMLFGGTNRTENFNDTWAYDPNKSGNKFTLLNPSDSCGTPPYRMAHQTSFDPTRNEMLLYSGDIGPNCGGIDSQETWIFSTISNTWSQETSISTQLPPPRYDSSGTFDSIHNLHIIFGRGGDYYTPLNDIWIYNGATKTWTQGAAATKPTARGYAMLAFDSTNDLIFMMGGSVEEQSGVIQDMWIYNHNFPTPGWTKLSPPSMPAGMGRGDHLSYNTKRNVLVLFTNDGVWYYRFSGTLPPPDTTSPNSPTGLRVN